MPYFEITGLGYNASTDHTDHKVLWVAADSFAQLDEAIRNCSMQGVDELSHCSPAAIDFTLPRDAIALRMKLQSFATTESQLVDLLRNLLDVSDLQLEGLEEDTVEAMAKAQSFLDTHFPEKP